MKEELRKFWAYLLSEGMLTNNLHEESFEQWVYDNYIRDTNVIENPLLKTCPFCLMGRDELEPNWQCSDCRGETDI